MRNFADQVEELQDGIVYPIQTVKRGTEIQISSAYQGNDTYDLVNDMIHETGHVIFRSMLSQNQKNAYWHDHWTDLGTDHLRANSKEFLNTYSMTTKCDDNGNQCFPKEDFAVHFAAYYTNEKQLRIRCPNKFSFLKKNIFVKIIFFLKKNINYLIYYLQLGKIFGKFKVKIMY